ncbi:MAG: hypothetical protein QNK23_10655 [Crocinitomicaceae bacterium]|nr:hypothetical protein [Crocinitomicaceae bacterium]
MKRDLDHKAITYLSVMTCQHCCGAESVFDAKSAGKDLKSYKRKGPNKTTAVLLQELYKEDLTGKTLLDIGGGIGVIQHELFKKGIAASTDIDASSAYQNRAKDLGEKNGTLEKMQFLHGDFVDLIDKVDGHDIVTLEKVACCYPDVERLILSSTAKANYTYVLVYPRENFLSRMLIKITHVYFWLKKNPFRTFVHSEAMMQKLIEEQGFELKHKSNKGIWRIVVYQKEGVS